MKSKLAEHFSVDAGFAAEVTRKCCGESRDVFVATLTGNVVDALRSVDEQFTRTVESGFANDLSQ